MRPCANPPNGGVSFVGFESPKGDGKWGQADLGGNVEEWTLDSNEMYATQCSDCANLTPGAQRSIRGGAFRNAALYLRGASRISSEVPSARSSNFGIRCARVP